MGKEIKIEYDKVENVERYRGIYDCEYIIPICRYIYAAYEDNSISAYLDITTKEHKVTSIYVLLEEGRHGDGHYGAIDQDSTIYEDFDLNDIKTVNSILQDLSKKYAIEPLIISKLPYCSEKRKIQEKKAKRFPKECRNCDYKEFCPGLENFR